MCHAAEIDSAALQLPLPPVPKILTGNQTIAGAQEGPVIIATGATVTSDNAVINGELTISPEATLVIPNNRSLTIGSVLRNMGTIRMTSRWDGSALSGAGRVENYGRIEINQEPNWGNGPEAVFNLRVVVFPGGSFQVNRSGFAVFGKGGHLDSRGSVRIEPGGRLRLSEDPSATTFSVNSSSGVAGRGELRLDGVSRLQMNQNATVESILVLTGESRVEGTGVMTLQSDQSLTGTYLAPVTVDSNAVVNVISATFSNRLSVLPKGTLTILNNRALNLHGELLNQGLIQMSSRHDGSVMQGSGRVLNAGVFQVYREPNWGNGPEAVVRVAVQILQAGRLWLSESGFANWSAGSRLEVLGQVELEPGSRLRFDASLPGRELVAAGGNFTGPGLLQMEGTNQFVIVKETRLPQRLAMYGESQVAGTAPLRLEQGQSLTGRYASPLVVAAGASVSIDAALITGNLVVEEKGYLEVPNGRTLALNGALTNRGKIRMMSRWDGSAIRGAGHIENQGTFEIAQSPNWGNAPEAVIAVPVTNSITGTLAVLGSGFCVFAGDINFATAGSLTVAGGGRLRFQAKVEGLGARMIYRRGNRTTGPGVIQLDGNDLLMDADAIVPAPLALGATSRVSGAGRLILRGSQALGGEYAAPMILDPGAAVVSHGGRITGHTIIMEGGLLELQNNQRLTLHGTIRNQGTLRMFSRWDGSLIDGKGRIENAGLIEISQSPGWGSAPEANLAVGIEVVSGGLFRVNGGGFGVFTPGGSLAVAGGLQIEGGGRLRFNETEPGQRLTFHGGVTATGRGELRCDGNSHLFMAGDATVHPWLTLTGSARVEGPGTLTLQAEQNLTGTYFAPLVVGTNGLVHSISATFSNRTRVEAGGRLTIRNNRSLRLESELNLLGVLEMSSRHDGSTLSGKGYVLNSGLFEILQDPGWGNGPEAVVKLPVVVQESGMLLLRENGFGNWSSGGRLEVTGMIELRSGSRLRFDESTPGRELISFGGAFGGPGRLQFDGANRFVVNRDTRLPNYLAVGGGSTVIANAPLIVQNGQDLTGNYQGSIVVARGATVAAFAPTMTGSVLVESGGTLTLPNNTGLMLHGVLTNQGTVRMDSRHDGSWLRGSGRVENEGLFEVVQSPGWGNGPEAVIQIPLRTRAAGTFRVAGSGFAAISGKVDFVVAGNLEVRGAGRLRFDAAGGTNSARLVMRDSNRNFGDGVIQLDGNEMWLDADAAVPVRLALARSSQVKGPGQLILQRGQELSGEYFAPLVLDTGAAVAAANGRIAGHLTIRPEASLDLPNNRALFVDGTIRNEGVIRMSSRWDGSAFRGAGVIENEARFEINQQPGWGNAPEAVIAVVLQNSATGSLVVNSGGFAFLEAPGQLRGTGSVTVHDRLRIGTSTIYHGALDIRAALVIAGDRTELLALGTLAFAKDSFLENPGVVCAPRLANGGVRVSGRPPLDNCLNTGSAPRISVIPHQYAKSGLDSIDIPVAIADSDTADEGLLLSARASDSEWIPAGSMIFSGSGTARVLRITPAAARSGSVLVTVTAADPQKYSFTRSFNLAFAPTTATSQNQAPVISPLAGVSIDQDQSKEVRFTVSDLESSAGALAISAASSSPSLFPTVGDALSGSGAERVLKLAPAAGQSGSAFITLFVRDPDGAVTKTVFLSTVLPLDSADSDGDGVSDARELKAGTDPRNKRDFFGFPEPPRLSRFGGNWSITIRTVPGRLYVLQAMDLSAGFRWTDVARVKAVGGLTTLEDPGSGVRLARIYRTVLLDEPPEDAIAPQIGSLTVKSESPGHYVLGVTATDASGIRSVEFLDRNLSLGRAERIVGDRWELPVRLPVNSLHELRIVVTDSAGNSGSTEEAGVFLADPNLLGAIDTSGRANYGQAIMLRANGTLPAVAFRPFGPDPFGAKHEFTIHLAAGSRVMQTASGPAIESAAATGDFGVASIFRLPEPLMRADGMAVRLPLNRLTVQQILTAFGRPPVEGLAIRLFGHLPIRWLEGSLEPGGLRDAKFKLELPDIPVPKDSASGSGIVLELDSRKGVRLPLWGEVTLPNQADGSVKLSIPPSRPLVLLARPDGSMAVEGRGAVEFRDGPKFTVDVALNDPYYALEISAENLQLPSLDALYPRLPSPGAVPGTGATAAQLDAAAVQLDAVWCSYRHFAASAPPCLTFGESLPISLPLPPTPASVMEAWAYAARADAGLASALAQNADLLAQLTRKSRGARDLAIACQYHLALLRARLSATAVQSGAIEAPLRAARATLARLANDSEAVRELAMMSAIAACLLEAESLSQQAGTTATDPALTEAVRGLVTRFVQAESTRYSITNTALGPVSGVVNEMDRFHAQQALIDTLTVWRLAQQVSADATRVTSVLRTIAQTLGARAWLLANEALIEAEHARDYPQFTIALGEAMAVMRIAEAGVFDLNSLGNPTASSVLQSSGARLQAVFVSDLNKGFRAEHLSSLRQEMQGMLAVVRDSRVVLDSWREVARALFDRCERTLGEAIVRERAAPGTLAATDLTRLLCAGTLQSELGRRFGLSGQVSWESDRLGQAVELVKTAPKRTWVTVHEAVECLLQESAQMAVLNDQARRQSALAAAASLLATERELASSTWLAAKSCPGFGALADMALPGGILIDEVAGGGSYSRETRTLRGAFSGVMRVPGFGGQFAIQNASFDTSGAFDLSASGSLTMPSAQDARLRLTVPSDRPLHIALRRPGRVAMSGGIKVELNGMAFDAYASLDDPVYVVGAAARGMQFAVINSLKPLLPTLNQATVYDTEVLRDLSALYSSFSQGSQGLLTPQPAASAAKASLQATADESLAGIPNFQLPPIEMAAAPVIAIVQTILVDGRLGVTREYDALIGHFTNQMARLSKQLKITEFRPADVSGLQSVSNEVALVERMAKAHADESNPASSQMRALGRGVTFLQYLGAIDSFLAGQILKVTNVIEPKDRGRVEELARLAGRFVTAARVFPDFRSTDLRAAFTAFVRGGGPALEFYGLNVNTGAPIPGNPRFESLTTHQLKEAIVTYAEIQKFHLQLGTEEGDIFYPAFINAANLIRSRLFALYAAELAGIVPLDWVPLHNKLMTLHPLAHHPHGTFERSDPQLRSLEPLLQVYREINRLTRAMLLLVPLGQQFGDPSQNLGTELDRATLTLQGALLFANNIRTNGLSTSSAPNYQGADYRIKVWPAASTASRAEGGVCRPDLEALSAGLRDRNPTAMFGSELEQLFEDSVKAIAPCILADIDLEAHTYKVATPASKAVGNLSELGVWLATNAPTRAVEAAASLHNLLRSFVPAGGLSPFSAQSPIPTSTPASRPVSWPELAELSRILLDALDSKLLPEDSPFRTTLLAEANRLVRMQASQAAVFASRLATVPSFDLFLPGGVFVNSVFGELTIDRSIPLLAARLGGRLEFPGLQGVAFDVTEASLDTHFNFGLIATATGLRIGPGELTQGSLSVRGNPGERYFRIEGRGAMRFNNSNEVGVAIAYLPETKDLVFATDVENASGVIRLTDNLVLFKAGLGLRLNTQQPISHLTNSATVGLFAKRPLSNPPQEDDFHLVVRNALTVLSTDFATLTGSFSILGGELLLPPRFSAGVCDAAAPTLQASTNRPLVGILPNRPLTAALKLRAGSTASDLRVESFTLSGGIEIERVGLRPSASSGFGAEICRGELLFPGVELGSGIQPALALPKFTLVEGLVSLPFPSGQTNYLVATNVVFGLDGLPTGTVYLRNDLRLLDLSAFNLTLLGGDSCGPGQLATGLQVQQEDNKLTLRLHGGIRAGIPRSVLESATNSPATNNPATNNPATNNPAITNPATNSPATNNPPNIATNSPAANPPAILAPLNNGVEMTTCASIILREGALPELDIRTLSVSGSFKLGGTIPIEGATLTLSNLHQAFNLAPGAPDPFTIALSGTIYAPNGPGFGLRDTRFVFNNLNPEIPGLPQFIPGTLVYDGSRWSLRNYLPIFVDHAELTFKNGALSFPGILNPTNLLITTTASISLPNPTDPILGGSVRDLSITFLADGQPQFSLDGIGLDIQPGKLKLPPINDLGGRLYIGGLSDPVNHPERLFFAGRLSGTYSEMKLALLAAFKLTGPIGMCIDVRGGSMGIPLPWGFVINGASGGISYLNNNSNPCDIRGYIDSQSGRPVGEPPADAVPLPWTQVKTMVEQLELRAEHLRRSYQPAAVDPNPGQPPVALLSQAPSEAAPPTADRRPQTAEENLTWLPQDSAFKNSSEASPRTAEPQAALQGEAADEFPCPGDCPPYTINIFCQPHPDTALYPKRVILKFSSIEPSTLSLFGITKENIGRISRLPAPQIARSVAVQLRTNLMASVKLPPQGSPADGLFIQLFSMIESGISNEVQRAIGGIQGSGDFIYSKIAEVAYRGVPCQDVTLLVSGTFSHSAIGMFMSLTGEVLLSTSGTAGVSGRVNFLGLPVGTGKVFITGTDDQGGLNPALCGEVNVAVGPLDIGVLKAALQCDGCISGLTEIAANLVLSLGRDVIRAILQDVAPPLADLTQQQLVSLITSGPQTIGTNTVAFPPELQTAFLAVLLQAGPSIIPANAKDQFITAVDRALDVFNPEFVLCGQVLPKLFGLPLGAKAVSASYRLSRDGRQALVGFAPSTLLRLLMDPRFSPPEFDEATMGYNEPLPAEEFKATILAGLRGDLLDPQRVAAFAKEQVRRFLERNTMTATYEMTPLGLSLARAAGRAVMPDFTRHPVVHGFTRPEFNGLPSRVQLLMQMIRTEPPVLGNPFWYGRDQDLANLYPAGSVEATRLAGRSLTRDYFPHGGFIGAGYIDVPRALYDPPPVELATALNPATNAFARLAAAFTYVTEYVLKTTNAGQLAFYLPAPNPPRDLLQAPQVDPEAVLDAMRRFEVPPTGLHGLGELYPMREAFLTGFLTNRLLGVELGTATVEGVPPGNGGDAYLRGSAQMSNDPRNWLRHFARQAQISFEIRQSPTQSIAQAFSQWQTDLALATNGVSESVVRQRVTAFVNRFYDQLPKANLSATLTNLALSPELASQAGRLVTIPDGSGSFELAAFSPRFSANEPGSGPKVRAKRDGGYVISGRVVLGRLYTNMVELAVLPKPFDPLMQVFPPDLAASVQIPVLPIGPGLTLSAAALELDTRTPALSVTGRLSTIDLGPLMRVRPMSGSTLSAGFTMAPTGQGVQLSIVPSLFESDLLLGPGRSMWIHGAGGTSTPFTYSSDSAWSATLSLTGNQPLELKDATGKVLVRTANTNASRILLSRTPAGATWITEVRVEIPASRDIVILPADPLEQTIRFNSSRTLSVRSDGTFSFSGNQQGALAFPTLGGLPIGQVEAGASIELDRSVTSRDSAGTPTAYRTRLAITGAMSGRMLPGGTSSAASSQLAIELPGGVRLTGAVQLPRLQFGELSLTPSVGAAFDVELDPAGLRLATTVACLNVSGNRVGCFPLNTISAASDIAPRTAPPVARASVQSRPPTRVLFPATGDFTISSGTLEAELFGFNLANTTFQFVRRNGVVSAAPISGEIVLPVVGGKARISGAIAADGSYSLESTTAFNVPTLSDWGIGSMSSVRANLRRYWENVQNQIGSEIVERRNLRLEGSMSGGALNQFTAPGGATGWLELSSSAITSGEARFSSIDFSGLRIAARDGAALTASLASTGLKLNPKGVRLSFNGTTVCDFDLPDRNIRFLDVRWSIPSSGDWAGTLGPITTAFHGIALGSSNFKLGRQNGVLGLHGFTGTTVLVFPVFGSMRFEGSLVNSTLNLRAKPPILTLGGFEISKVEFKISSAGIEQFDKIELKIGGRGWIKYEEFKVTAGGVSFSSGNNTHDTGWLMLADVPNMRLGDTYQRFAYTYSFNAVNFTAGNLGIRVKGTAATWVDPGVGDKPNTVNDAALRLSVPLPPFPNVPAPEWLTRTSPNLSLPVPSAWNIGPPQLNFTLW